MKSSVVINYSYMYYIKLYSNNIIKNKLFGL